MPIAHGSYDDLLADPSVEAIYNPLPNHLHVDWSIAALEAGKHVLCEKTLGLDTADARRLVDAAANHPSLVVMEAFMYRFHPQWIAARELVSDGRMGELGTIKHSSATSMTIRATCETTRQSVVAHSSTSAATRSARPASSSTTNLSVYSD